MPIREETIREMQEVLREDYGREVTQAEALEITHTLVRYFDLLTKMHHRETTKDNYDNKAPNN